MTTCHRCHHPIDDDQAAYAHPDGVQHTALQGCIESGRRAVIARILRGDALGEWDDEPDPTDFQTEQMTDTAADREYAEDADRAADRYERERGL